MPGRPSRRTVLAASLAFPVLGGCAAGRTGTSRGGRAVITFWSALRGSQQVVDAFNHTQNRIQVDFQRIPSGRRVAMPSSATPLPLIVAFMMLQRFWRSGLTAGVVR